MRNFKSFASFILSILLIIVAMKAINYLPLLIQKDSMKHYRSIEELKKGLDIKDIFIPAFFPEELSWPPSEVLGQGRPFLAIIMEFRSRKDNTTALVICQSTSKKFRYDDKLKIKHVRDNVNYSFKGRGISITTGSCENGETCTGASWNEGRYWITVRARFEPPRTLKIVESMIH